MQFSSERAELDAAGQMTWRAVLVGVVVFRHPSAHQSQRHSEVPREPSTSCLPTAQAYGIAPAAVESTVPAAPARFLAFFKVQCSFSQGKPLLAAVHLNWWVDPWVGAFRFDWAGTCCVWAGVCCSFLTL